MTDLPTGMNSAQSICAYYTMKRVPHAPGNCWDRGPRTAEIFFEQPIFCEKPFFPQPDPDSYFICSNFRVCFTVHLFNHLFISFESDIKSIYKKLTKLVHNRMIYFHNISVLNAHNARLMFYDTCKRTAAILPWQAYFGSIECSTCFFSSE